jgi:hypothetical protein
MHVPLDNARMDFMEPKRTRPDFTKATILAIAQRAAYRCSFPECDHTTIGPGAAVDDTVLTGIAAHIYSAAEDGPRGSGGLSFEDRQHINNAMWLCADHAARIDKNDGLEFSPATLKMYKRMHEEKISRERDGGGSKIGWIHSLYIDRAPVFRPPTEIQFGKVTILLGNNRSGKTAICDWLQGISDLSALSHWADPKKPGN